MWRGSSFDCLSQQRIFDQRSWIDAQPSLVAQGRAVCLFDAQEFSPDYLVELIDRFYRVFVFVAPAAKAELMREVSRAGHRAYPYVVLVGREDNLEHCRRLVREEGPGLRGASIIHLTDPADPAYLRQVQDLYAEANMFPQPQYFVAGSDNTVLTSLLVDEHGRAIGTTMYHHLVRAGPGFDAVACGLNSTIRPRKSHAVRPRADRSRSLSLAAWLNAAAILRCRDQFGVREIWSYPRANNRRAIAFHHELGARESQGVSCFCAEHRVASPDRRHTGNKAGPSASFDAETLNAGPQTGAPSRF
ncbi:MAG: hypothetical protein ACXWKR_11460 [Phenylobacterium sp.]